MKYVMLWVASAAVIVACTKPNPNYCNADADCDSATPFCDIAGEFDESDHEPNTCTVRPVGCSVERCGCEPGAPKSCSADQAQVCSADGRSTSQVGCPLGCADPTRCFELQPSNGLGAALAQAATEPDVRFPVGTVIDTDLGTATAGMTSIAVRSVPIAQPDGSVIRAFVARSLIIEGAIVRGENPLALVAAKELLVRGRILAKATGLAAGPGAQVGMESCVGEGDQLSNINGGGGGGNSVVGGAGGGQTPPGLPKRGGSAVTAFEPLRGGCSGGTMSGFAPVANGGGGGGGVQLVSAGTVTLSDTGLIDVGGGGGDDRGGGGSGGTVIIEAVTVHLLGSAAGVAANGGSGGGCNMRGIDGGSGTGPSFAPKCSPGLAEGGSASAGNGGTGLAMPEAADQWSCPPMFFCQRRGGGGGGGAGRCRIATKDGTIDSSGPPTMSASLSTAMISIK